MGQRLRRSARRASKLAQGMSLVEVMVSVAIVAVLVALISAMIVRAKNGARNTTCMQNLKQIGLSVDLYATDYSDSFPPYGTHWPSTILGDFNPSNPDHTFTAANLWKESLTRYGVKEPQFFCPDDPYTNPQVAQSLVPMRPLAHDVGGKARLVTSYFVTLSMRYRLIGLSRTAIQFPAETPYLSDGMIDFKDRTALYNHGTRLNVLHVDGSVKNYSNTHQFPPVVNPKP